jgi:hypothetical protein
MAKSEMGVKQFGMPGKSEQRKKWDRSVRLLGLALFGVLLLAGKTVSAQLY